MKMILISRYAALAGVAALIGSGNARADVIANSIGEVAVPGGVSDWSATGTQGENDWYYGYYDQSDDVTNGDGVYQVDDFQEFINVGGPIEPFDDPGTGDIANHWTGSAWDMADANSFTSPRAAGHVPWTSMNSAGAVHPNGTNNNGIEHWAIRRWVGNQLTEAVTPLAITWHTRKANANGSGVTGGIAVDGVIVDEVGLEGNDQVGVERTYYINAPTGVVIDLFNTPVGASGDRTDGSDGSVHWMTVDTEIPVPAFQPDGTLFRSATATDTDGDGIDDSWEELFGTLADFFEGGDFEGDGLVDEKEFEHGSDPTVADTDGDGVSDVVEEGFGSRSSGVGSDESDGDGISDFDEVNGTPPTNPGKADSDDDGSLDPEELLWGSDPNNGADTPLTLVVANSLTEWSTTGTQGENGWTYGYYDLTDDEFDDGVYQTDDFVPFANIGGQVEPDGNHWTGTIWDMADANSINGPAANVPWTQIQQEVAHPNGTNNSFEHWAIRRWVADELTESTSVGLIWNVRKQNPNGSGTSGVLMVNGKQVDKVTLAGNDQVGEVRRVFVTLEPGDIVDLALTPEGIGAFGLPDRNDGSDSSFFWYRVDTRLPAVPQQPNGQYFVPVGFVDSDGDDLADFWEEIFFPGDLTKLSGTGDFDEDGLSDRLEMERGGFPNDKDTDDDGLEDDRETGTGVAGPGDETGTDIFLADTDGDGKSDGDEVDGPTPTDPFNPDSDFDNLTDGQETNTGVYVSFADTGSDPNDDDSDDDTLFDGDEIFGNPDSDPNSADGDDDGILDVDELFTTLTDPWRYDTDGDGWSDGEEELDPNSFSDDAPAFGITKPAANEIANSEFDFTLDGTQGDSGWFYGYRNVTAEGNDGVYDPDTDFIEFDAADWDGAKWDLGAGAPWTEVTQTGGHPNGTNNVEEHWAMYRWEATVAAPTPAMITWNLRKDNTNGNATTGTSVLLYVNGVFADTGAVVGDDGEGLYGTFFAVLNPGDRVDLALTSYGPAGNGHDGSDGSFFGFIVDTALPNDPRQPDGTKFVVGGGGGDLAVTNVEFDHVLRTSTIEWSSSAGTTYEVWVSEDLITWTRLAGNLSGNVGTTSYADEFIDGAVTKRYYQVREVAP